MLSLLVAPFLPADADSQDVEAARQDGLDRIEHVAYAAAGQERPATLMVDGREVLLETALQEAGVSVAKVYANDKGALDCTIRARLKTALNRALEEEVKA